MRSLAKSWKEVLRRFTLAPTKRNQKAKKRRLWAETLESRQMLTTLYWDADGIAANNDINTGAGLGGSASWVSGSADRWFNPATGQNVAWNNANNDDAVFMGAAGTVNLSGSISAQSIQFQSNSYTLQDGSLTLPNGGTAIQVAGSSVAAINSMIVGTGGLTKAGSGTLILNGANTYTGNTIVSAGTVKIGNAAAFGESDNTITVQDGATVDINGCRTPSGQTFHIAGNGVGGNGALVNNGESGWDRGVCRLVLDADATVGGTGRIDLRDASGVSTAGSFNAQTYNLTKVGGGQFTFSGMNDITLNDLTVNGGTFAFECNTGMGDATKTITVNDGARLAFWGYTAPALNKNIVLNNATMFNDGGRMGSIYGIAAIDLQGTVTLTGSNTIDTRYEAWDDSYGDITISGKITGNGGLTKTGAATLQLSNSDNDYHGGTELNIGTLIVAGDAYTSGMSFISPIGNGALTLHGGTLSMGGAERRILNRVNVSGNVAFGRDASDGTAAIYQFSGPTGPITLTGDATLTVNSPVTVNWGGVSGGYNLTKAGAGTLTLGGVGSSFTGNTTIQAGTLAIGSNSSLGTGSLSFSGNGALQAIADVDLGDRAITINNGANGTLDTNGFSINSSGLIGGQGGLSKIGAGLLTLNGANTYAGNTVVSAGTVQVGNDAAFGESDNTITVQDGATVDINGHRTLSGQTVHIAGSGVDGIGALVNNSSDDSQNYGVCRLVLDDDATVGGIGRVDIRDANGPSTVGYFTSQNHDLTKVGDGSLIFSGISASALNNLTVNGGSFKFERYYYDFGVMGDATKTITVNDGASLDFGGFSNNGLQSNLVLNNATLVNNAEGRNTHGVVDLQGSVTLTGSNILDAQHASWDTCYGDIKISGTVGGTGGLTKIGAGSLTLNGANTYAGDTIVSAGTVQIGNAAAFGESDNTITVQDGATVDINGHRTLAGQSIHIAGSGVGGVGALVNNNTTSFESSGVCRLVLDADATIGGIGRVDLRDANGYGTVGYLTAQNYDLTKVGSGSLVFSGVGAGELNDLTVNGGSFQFDRYFFNFGVMGDSTKTITVNDGASLIFGGFSNAGLRSNLVLNNGTLANDPEGWNNAGAVDLQGAVTLTGSNILDAQHASWDTCYGDIKISGTVSGTGGLTKAGSGTLILNGANTYTGNTIVSAGTVKIGNAAAFGESDNTITVQDGATVDINGCRTPSGQTFHIAGNGVGGNGALVNNGESGWDRGVCRLVLDADATVGGTGRIDLRDASGVSTAGSFNAQTYNLTKVGGGQFTFSGMNDIALNDLTVNGGTFAFECNTGMGDATKTITVNDGARLAFWGYTAPALNKNIVLNNATMFNDGGRMGSIYGIAAIDLQGTVTLTGSNTIDTRYEAWDDSYGDITISGKITGNGGLTKTGAATLQLSNSDNDYLGTVLNNGTLIVAGDTHHAPDYSSFTSPVGKGSLVLNGGTLSMGGVDRYIDNRVYLSGNVAFGRNGADGKASFHQFDPARPITLTGDATMTVNSPVDTTYSSITGNFSLTKDGYSTLDLGGRNNSYTGGTTITGGILAIASGDSLGTGSLTFNGGYLCRLQATDAVDLGERDIVIPSDMIAVFDTNGHSIDSEGVISGEGGLIKYGAGTLTLSGANTYTGLTNVQTGTLNMLGTFPGELLFWGGSITGNALTSLSSDPATTTLGSPVTLTASVVGSPTSVAFYRDTNGNGDLDASDGLLGTDTSADGGWSLANVDTTNWNLGTNMVFAQITFGTTVSNWVRGTVDLELQEEGQLAGQLIANAIDAAFADWS